MPRKIPLPRGSNRRVKSSILHNLALRHYTTRRSSRFDAPRSLSQFPRRGQVEVCTLPHVRLARPHDNLRRALHEASSTIDASDLDPDLTQIVGVKNRWIGTPGVFHGSNRSFACWATRLPIPRWLGI